MQQLRCTEINSAAKINLNMSVSCALKTLNNLQIEVEPTIAFKYRETGITEFDMMQITQQLGNYDPVKVIINSNSSNIGTINDFI